MKIYFILLIFLSVWMLCLALAGSLEAHNTKSGSLEHLCSVVWAHGMALQPRRCSNQCQSQVTHIKSGEFESLGVASLKWLGCNVDRSNPMAAEPCHALSWQDARRLKPHFLALRASSKPAILKHNNQTWLCDQGAQRQNWQFQVPCSENTRHGFATAVSPQPTTHPCSSRTHYLRTRLRLCQICQSRAFSRALSWSLHPKRSLFYSNIISLCTDHK